MIKSLEIIPMMTPSEAERILDIVSDALLTQTNLPYKPVSLLQGVDVFRCDAAIKLRVANEYLALATVGESLDPLRERVRQWATLSSTVVSTFVPDNDLLALEQIPRSSPAYFPTMRKLFNNPLAVDECGKYANPRFADLETLDSFVAYCEHLGESDPNFWERIHARIGIEHGSSAPRGNTPVWEVL